MKNHMVNMFSEANDVDSERRWFTCENHYTAGPLSTSEVVASLKDNSNMMVWWRGSNEWVPASEWLKKKDLVCREEDLSYFLDSGDQQPKSLNETIQELKTKPDLYNIEIRTSKGTAPQKVFEIAAIRKALGLKARKQKRVSVLGNVSIKTGDLRVVGQLKTVSAGGVGVKVPPNVKIHGDVVLRFNCLELLDLAPIQATILYSKDGYLGLKFKQIPVEMLDEIVTYIRQNPDRVA